jgi:hypothetical protein
LAFLLIACNIDELACNIDELMLSKSAEYFTSFILPRERFSPPLIPLPRTVQA